MIYFPNNTHQDSPIIFWDILYLNKKEDETSIKTTDYEIILIIYRASPKSNPDWEPLNSAKALTALIERGPSSFSNCDW